MDNKIPKRHSIRLKNYDYSQPGAYFITVCTQNKKCILGSINDNKMILNFAGEVVQSWLGEIVYKFPNVLIEEYVIMPNHFHMVILITEKEGRGGPACPPAIPKTTIDIKGRGGPACPPGDETYNGKGEHSCDPQKQHDQNNPSIESIIQWIKTMTTNEYIRGVKKTRLAAFSWETPAAQLL